MYNYTNDDNKHLLSPIYFAMSSHAFALQITLSPQAIHLAFWPWFKKDKAEERDYSTA